MKKPEKLSRHTIYLSSRVNLYTDKIKMPTGKIINKFHYLDFKRDSVGIIAKRREKYLFVRAYRYVTDTIEWEIPAGQIEQNETVNDAVTRELLEETGYKAQNIEILGSYYPLNDIANKKLHVAVCSCIKINNDIDKNEVESIKWISEYEIRKMIKTGLIKDGLTISAFFFLFNNFFIQG